VACAGHPSDPGAGRGPGSGPHRAVSSWRGTVRRRSVHDHAVARCRPRRGAADGAGIGQAAPDRIERTAGARPACSWRRGSARAARARAPDSGCGGVAAPAASCGSGRARPGSAGSVRCGAARQLDPRPALDASARSGDVITPRWSHASRPAARPRRAGRAGRLRPVQRTFAAATEMPELLRDLPRGSGRRRPSTPRAPGAWGEVLQRARQPGQRRGLLGRLSGCASMRVSTGFPSRASSESGAVAPAPFDRRVRVVRGDPVQPGG